MQLRAVPLSFALVWYASGQVSAPDAAEQKAMIARMREAAVNYADRLQDFLCTQLTTCSVDTSGSGKHWKALETQELETRVHCAQGALSAAEGERQNHGSREESQERVFHSGRRVWLVAC